jgi:regulator of extracellular matrix RemA (YlzA/DUF370 family)
MSPERQLYQAILAYAQSKGKLVDASTGQQLVSIPVMPSGTVLSVSVQELALSKS